MRHIIPTQLQFFAVLVLMTGCQATPYASQAEIIHGKNFVHVPAFTQSIETGFWGDPHNIHIEEYFLELCYTWDTAVDVVEIKVDRVAIPVDLSNHVEFRSGISHHIIGGPYNPEIAPQGETEQLIDPALSFSLEERRNPKHYIHIVCHLEVRRKVIGPPTDRRRADILSIRFVARNELTFERRVINCNESTGTVQFPAIAERQLFELNTTWGEAETIATAIVGPREVSEVQMQIGRTRIDITTYEQLSSFINKTITPDQ